MQSEEEIASLRGNPPLLSEQIVAIVRGALGPQYVLTSFQPLGGGTFNRTYLLHFDAEPPLVLRVAPPPNAAHLSWDDEFLMRREYTVHPYLTLLTPSIPRIVVADFTHQVVDRDFMIQTFLPGERWDTIEDELSASERDTLWSQFGGILRTIHTITGSGFGTPHITPLFPTWSEAVLYRLERISQAMQASGVDPAVLTPVLDIAGENIALLNEVQRPALLHGDLWLFNLLVTRSGPTGEATITGVLDADRAWWGDPAADWTMFILRMSEEDDYSAFWQGYGTALQETPGTVFRERLYTAMHIATAWVWAAQNDNAEMLRRAPDDMAQAMERLRSSVG